VCKSVEKDLPQRSQSTRRTSISPCMETSAFSVTSVASVVHCCLRRAILIAGILLVATSASGQVQRVPADVRMPPHPRLLLLRGEEQGILRAIAADSSRRRIHQAIISGADELLPLPPALPRRRGIRRCSGLSRPR
jgi:hypothetical protein